MRESEKIAEKTWEEAYKRFETTEEEIRKFRKRLIKMGALTWPRSASIVEMFCGRGSGLHALEQLGFTQIEGVDLSRSLITEYKGQARCYVADCRELAFYGGSKDIVIIQGGLHHLLVLPQDLDKALFEAHRILKNDGLIMIVEPWLTPFLNLVHFISQIWLARFIWHKLDAFYCMYQLEKPTYEQWLNNRRIILELFEKYFITEKFKTNVGKIWFLGKRKIL